MTFTDHPLRSALANELHARPFPRVSAPCIATFLAFKQPKDAAARDRGADISHLIALLDHFGAEHPIPNSNHFSGQIGKHFLKWESHTEFVTYTVMTEGNDTSPFDATNFGVFPKDWLAAAPASRITSALIHIETAVDDTGLAKKTADWFSPESLVVSRVLDNDLVVAADFRIDPAGHMRFAIFVRPNTGAQRIGRVLQRLCEIETYKTVAMLGFHQARELSLVMGEIDQRLTALLRDMGDDKTNANEALHGLLQVSAELENAIAQSTFRFGATGAYETIVNQRIQVLREARFEGRQTFSEFMMRRFDPAMRTVHSTQARLQSMSDRALRAGDLLRTRVDVERSAQNQKLLASMDKRADQQLRLQHTVEGLSVVAISYYAVNLVLYMTGPLEKLLNISKISTAAVIAPVVLLLVWFVMRQIRRRLE